MILKKLFIPLFALLSCLSNSEGQELISIRGAHAAAEPVNAAAAQLAKEAGLEFRILTEGGSGSAVAGIGDDVVDVALLSRRMTPRELSQWPDRQFQEVRFGQQAVIVVVPEQVWNSGVHSLTAAQLRDIYERRVANWKELGGEDRKVSFYNRDVRSSIWEMVSIFLYEDTRKTPTTDAEVLADASDVTTAVEFNGGSISFLEYNAPRPASVKALGLRLADGTVVEPTAANIAAGRYALSRPLMIATSRKPVGRVRRFIEFMLAPEGQSFVKQTGHVTNRELEGQ